jgi:cell division protein FtsN
LLCGLKAKAAGIDGAILDIGLITPTKGAKIFAAMNGVLDAGVEIPHGEEKMVKERNKGDHIAKYAKSLGAGSEEYAAKFSKYTAKDVSPENLPEHFSKVKADIVGSFKGAKVAAEPEIQAKPAAKEKASTPKVASAPVKEKAVPAKAKEAAPKEKTSKAKAEPEAKAAPAKAAPVAKAEKAPAKAAQAKAAPKEKASAKEKVAPAKEKSPAKKATKKGGKKE